MSDKPDPRVFGSMVVVAVAVLLAIQWPEVMRRVSRGLAGVVAVALLCVIATGWIDHHRRFVAATHKWSAHSLIIIGWDAALLAVGFTLTRVRSHPRSTVGRVVMFLLLLGVLFLASLSGYLGPSSGPSDEMTLRRFEVLHYWVFPTLAIALVAWWYAHLGSVRKALPSEDIESPGTAL